MPISPITLNLEGVIEFPLQESERNPNKSNDSSRISVPEWLLTMMNITMKLLQRTRLVLVSMISWAPVEDFLEGFEGVEIENIHVGAGLIGFNAEPILTCNRILVNLC